MWKHLRTSVRHATPLGIQQSYRRCVVTVHGENKKWEKTEFETFLFLIREIMLGSWKAGEERKDHEKNIDIWKWHTCTQSCSEGRC